MKNAAPRPGHVPVIAGEKNFPHSLSPSPKVGLLSLPSCPTKGRFLEAILQRAEQELARPGRPGTVDGLVAGGALGGAAPSLGRARCLAARGGFTTHLKGTHWCPGASHRSIPPRGSRGIGKPRTHCAARTRKLGCLKFGSPVSCPGRDAAFFMPLRRTGIYRVDCQVAIAPLQGWPDLSTALANTTRRRSTAIRATLGGFPLAMRRS
jgi:hypothetical protein